MLTMLKQRFGGLAASVIRFPVTAAFLAAAAVLTAVAIGSDSPLARWISACAVGAAACAAGQAAYERFFDGAVKRAVLMAAGVAVAALFYLSVATVKDNSAALFIRPAVTLFALFIGFVWVGVIQSRYGFQDSFMAAFKALFQAAFFSGILFLGVAAVIAALDRLIVPVHEDAYAHTANIVFLFGAPLILLSMIPVYPGKSALAAGEDHDDGKRALIEKRIGCPRFLEVLLSYIIVPLIAVFTVILVSYILLNIGGDFWTNNLLEPMLIAYTVVVITAVLLTGRLENRFAVLFRKIFPKVLIPIALFQVVASALLLSETGVTYGRYYVILYGVFAVLSGLVLSVLPLKKSGLVALLLIALSAVSLIPPVDAFTVSRASQINALEQTLRDNGMLNNGVVTPNGSIPEADKTKITSAVRYLSETEELDEVSWLPEGFTGWDDTAFFNVFGFHMYQQAEPEYRYVSVYLDAAVVVPVTGYDYMARLTLPYPEKSEVTERTFTVGGAAYRLSAEDGGGGQLVTVRDETGQALFTYDTAQIFERYAAFLTDKQLLTAAEATFAADSPGVEVKIIVMNASFTLEPQVKNPYADLLVLVRVAEFTESAQG
jgi:hypothetical protein